MVWAAEAGMVRDDTLVVPVEATEEDLLVVHTKRYLSSLRVRWYTPCLASNTLFLYMCVLVHL